MVRNILSILTLFICTCSNLYAQPLWQTLNDKVVQLHIIPGHKAFNDKALAFEKVVPQFCSNPSEQSLALLRERFREVNNAWMRIQHIKHGPIEENRRLYRIQLFPDKRNAVGKHLALQFKKMNFDKLTPKNFSRLSAALQGINALENLLYSPRFTFFELESEEKRKFHCGLLSGISLNLSNISTRLLAEWTTDESLYAKFVNEKKYPLKGSAEEQALTARTEITSRIFNGYYTQLQLILERKLLLPLGKSAERAKPHFSEAYLSQHSTQNIAINLQTLESLYELTYAPYLEMKTNGEAVHKKIKQAYADVHQQISLLQAPLSQAVGDENLRPAVELLVKKLENLFELTIGEMRETIVIPMRFNSLDGD